MITCKRRAAAAALFIVTMFAQPVRAAELPGSFVITPTSGTSPLSVTITWNVSPFSGGTCVASGSWSGPKALSGSQAVTNLTANASYTLTCTRSMRGSASLSWTAPTRNTDGSTLSNLSGYRIHYGTTSTDLVQTVQVGTATTYDDLGGCGDRSVEHRQ
jgi:hypothetical protein